MDAKESQAHYGFLQRRWSVVSREAKAARARAIEAYEAKARGESFGPSHELLIELEKLEGQEARLQAEMDQFAKYLNRQSDHV